MKKQSEKLTDAEFWRKLFYGLLIIFTVYYFYNNYRQNLPCIPNNYYDSSDTDEFYQKHSRGDE